MIYPVSLIILALILFVVTEVTSIRSYEEDMRITGKEKATLEKFKELVVPKIPETSLVRNYINDDLYFIRWLRAASFDVAQAERMLLDHLKWREEQRMDTIHEEDWSYFEKEYPLFTDTQDKEGRPGAELWFGEYDLRKAVLAGRGPQLIRWLFTTLEMGQRQLYEARANGRKVSQTVMLADIAGFNLVQHACSRCMTIYAPVVLAFVQQYPDQFGSIPIVNMIPSFDIIISLLKSLLGPNYRDLLSTYVRKSQWEPVLDATFEKSQRSLRFGGTKARANDT